MAPTPQRPLMIEEFVQGDEHSFDSVFLGSRIAWHSINDYLPAALEVLREPWIQWAVLLPRGSGSEAIPVPPGPLPGPSPGAGRPHRGGPPA